MPFKAESLVACEEFLTMLAHELRNPLAPIKNAIHILERQTSLNESRLSKNATDVLDRQVDCIANTINDLLDITQVVKGELKINKDKVDILEIINLAIQQCENGFNSRKLTIETVLPEKSIYVMGDHIRLLHTIKQLLNNSTKLTETGGTVVVSVTYSDERVMVNVRDNGIGMPPADANNVFDLFSQNNHMRNMLQGGGLGVGLSLAQRIATLHDGSIEVCSSGIGEGCEFTLILPVYEIAEYKEPVLPPTNNENYNPLTIIVVDDHVDTAESLSVLLKIWGHTVHIAHNSKAAIDIATIYTPDVAILDIGLPGGDGCCLAESMKEIKPDMCLIAITGYSEDSDRCFTNTAGFSSHLVKPVDPQKLKKILNLTNQLV